MVPLRMSRSWPPPCTSAVTSTSRRTTSAPTPYGPPTLCPVRVSASTPRRGEVDRHRADRLDGVGVHRDAVLGRDRDDLVDRLQGADLVVGPHHRDQRDRLGVALDRVAQRVDVEPAASGRPGSSSTVGALASREPVQRVEHGVVLDGGGEDPGAPRVGGQPRPVDALEREVVGLGAAGGEHHLAGPAVQRLGDRLPRLLDDPPGVPPGGVQRARVADLDAGARSSPRPPRAPSAWWRRGRGRRSGDVLMTAPAYGGPSRLLRRSRLSHGWSGPSVARIASEQPRLLLAAEQRPGQTRGRARPWAAGTAPCSAG